MSTSFRALASLALVALASLACGAGCSASLAQGVEGPTSFDVPTVSAPDDSRRDVIVSAKDVEPSPKAWHPSLRNDALPSRPRFGDRRRF